MSCKWSRRRCGTTHMSACTEYVCALWKINECSTGGSSFAARRKCICVSECFFSCWSHCRLRMEELLLLWSPQCAFDGEVFVARCWLVQSHRTIKNISEKSRVILCDPVDARTALSSGGRVVTQTWALSHEILMRSFESAVKSRTHSHLCSPGSRSRRHSRLQLRFYKSFKFLSIKIRLKNIYPLKSSFNFKVELFVKIMYFISI